MRARILLPLDACTGTRPCPPERGHFFAGGSINRRSVFARKNYFYPDLPKGYQISQYELPIISGGELRIETKAGEKVIRLTRAHLEEDAGKSIHGESLSGVVGRGVVGTMVIGRPLVNEDRDLNEFSGIDLNRAGTPLLEIVSEPELHGPEEAVAYARALHALVRWIGICDGNMQEGSFRCDANVSVRKAGEKKLGTRCEIKNLNSFRFMEQAVEFEARRQIELLEDGGTVAQETRLFDPDKGETRAMRTKEEAHDYRYFPDPDLLPLVVTEELIEKLRREMPVSQDVLRRRFVHEYGFTDEMADTLVWERSRAEHADQFWGHLLRLTEGIDRMERALAANWAMMEIGAEMNRSGRPATSYPPQDLAMLVARILDKTISHKIAKEVFEAMTKGEGSPDQIIEKRGLRQISDTGSLEKVVDDVLSKNARQAEDYRAGKAKAFNALVGQVMKATQGKANPAQVNALLKKKLGR